jgi:hypothetical protein
VLKRGIRRVAQYGIDPVVDQLAFFGKVRIEHNQIVDPKDQHRALSLAISESPENMTKIAVDTLGDLLALLVTPANEQDRDQVRQLTQKVQAVTGEMVGVAIVDEGYTEKKAARAGKSIRLEVNHKPLRSNMAKDFVHDADQRLCGIDDDATAGYVFFCGV